MGTGVAFGRRMARVSLGSGRNGRGGSSGQAGWGMGDGVRSFPIRRCSGQAGSRRTRRGIGRSSAPPHLNPLPPWGRGGWIDLTPLRLRSGQAWPPLHLNRWRGETGGSSTLRLRSGQAWPPLHSCGMERGGVMRGEGRGGPRRPFDCPEREEERSFPLRPFGSAQDRLRLQALWALRACAQDERWRRDQSGPAPGGRQSGKVVSSLAEASKKSCRVWLKR